MYLLANDLLYSKSTIGQYEPPLIRLPWPRNPCNIGLRGNLVKTEKISVKLRNCSEIFRETQKFTETERVKTEIATFSKKILKPKIGTKRANFNQNWHFWCIFSHAMRYFWNFKWENFVKSEKNFCEIEKLFWKVLRNSEIRRNLFYIFTLRLQHF